MNPWTRKETIIAFSLYCKIPFGKCNKHHPLITKYASIIRRTPSALNMKIGNIGRLDPDLRDKGISGLKHGAKLEKEIWDEFADHPDRLAYESEKLVAAYLGQTVEECTAISLDNLPPGEEREAVIRQRVNQSFFRTAVLSAYSHRCCVSGVSLPELVEACHILDWAANPAQRTNPKNGLCMNAFFHKAYDQYLLTVTPDYRILLSDTLLCRAEEPAFRSYLQQLQGRPILLPDKFLPRQDFLDAHCQLFKQRLH